MVRLFKTAFQQLHKDKSIFGEAKAQFCIEVASVVLNTKQPLDMFYLVLPARRFQ